MDVTNTAFDNTGGTSTIDLESEGNLSWNDNNARIKQKGKKDKTRESGEKSTTSKASNQKSSINDRETPDKKYNTTSYICSSPLRTEEHRESNLRPKKDRAYERMQSVIYDTMDKWICESKNSLNKNDDPITISKVKQDLVNQEGKEHANNPDMRVIPTALSHFTTHGDQAEIPEHHVPSNDLIDFATEMENKDVPNQTRQINSNNDMSVNAFETDIETEVEKSVNEATAKVEKIGNIIRSISKAVQENPEIASPVYTKEIERVLQLVENLEEKIPGNIQLLDSFPEKERLRCRRIWQVISTELDAMNVLANAIKHNLRSS